MNISGVKLRIKIIIKAIFHTFFGKTRLKARILRCFSRDYELDSKEMEALFKKPLNDKTQRGDFIASLTSFPARIGILKYTLHSIFSQTLFAKKVFLVLSKSEFMEHYKVQNVDDSILPSEILAFKKYGLEILWVSENLYQFNKIIPVLQAFPDENLITIDDDIYYNSETFATLYNAHLQNNGVIFAHKSRIVPFTQDTIKDFFEWKIIRKANKKWQNRPAYNVFLEGCGGVFYPPHCLYKDVCNSAKFMALTPKADDIWLWSMALLQGTKIACVENPLMGNGAAFTNKATNPALWQYNMNGGNDKQMKAMLTAYPQILRILNGERDF